MHVDELQLEGLILDSNLVSREEMKRLKLLAKEKGKTLSELVVTEGHMREGDLRRLEAYLLGIPFIDLKNRQVDFALFALVPEPVARNHNIVAFAKEGEALEVALLDISDLSAVAFLRDEGLRLLPRLTDSESMKWALRAYQDALRSEYGDRIQQEVGKVKDDDALAPELADILLKHAFLQGATDIHIEPGSDHSLVRYRIGHLLRDAMILPARAVSAMARTMRRLAGLEHGHREGRFRIETGKENIMCRFSFLPVEGGERITIRLVRGRAHGFTLEGLGLEAPAVEDLYHTLFSGPGLVLAVGGAKSGKTTSLYTMLDLLNAPHRNILTLEDEIETRLPRVSQSRVSSQTGFTYARGLRTLLEQDPDVIMVGNLPDTETVALASHAAKRHLVLASLSAESPEAALKHFSSPRDLEHLKAIVFHASPTLGGVKRAVLSRDSGLSDLISRI